jgi:transposase
MVYGAIDLHMRHSQIRVIDADGKVLRDKRIATDRDELVKAFERWGTLRIVVETGTESEWVAQTLEAAGHEVVVVDPNYAPMYGETTRRVKTDRRDVAALAEANRRGWYRATHRVSAEQRAMRQRLRVRRQLVQMRTAAVSPMARLIATTTTEITALDRELRAQAATDPIVQRLLTVPASAWSSP